MSDEPLQLLSSVEENLLDFPDQVSTAALSSLTTACFQNQFLLSNLYWQAASDAKISALTAAVVSKQQKDSSSDENSESATSTTDPIELIPPDVLSPGDKQMSIERILSNTNHGSDRERTLEFLDSEGTHSSKLFNRRKECLNLLLQALHDSMIRFRNAHEYAESKRKSEKCVGFEQPRSESTSSIPPILRWGILSMFPLIESIGTLETIQHGKSSLKVSCISILLSILKNSPPLSLESENSETIDHMFKLVKSVESEDASGALIGLALQRGKLSHILDSITFLLQPEVKVDVEAYVRQLQTYGAEKQTSCVPENTSDILSWHHHPYNDSAKDFLVPEPHLHYSSIACDGKYLYIHKHSGIVKIGTGNSGTLMGHVYKFIPYRKGEQGHLVFYKDLLLYRSTGMQDLDFAFVICRNTLQEISCIRFRDISVSSMLLSHLMSDGIHLYILSTTDTDIGAFTLLTYTLEEEFAVQLRSTPLLPGFTQFPFDRRSWNTERSPSFHFFVGQKVDAKDSVSKWCPATVVKVTSSRVLVHYDGWSSKWDEWFEIESSRLAPLGQYTGKSNPVNESDVILNIPEAEWFWEDKSSKDDNQWHPFPSNLNSSIEDHYKRTMSLCTVRLNNRDYEIHIDAMERVDLATGEKCRLKRKDSGTVSKHHWEFLFDDICMYCSPSFLVCVIPPKCPPNSSSNRIMFRTFHLLSGKLAGDSFLDNFMEQEIPFSSVSYDPCNQMIWGYSAAWNSVHHWTNPQSINIYKGIEEEKVCDGFNICNQILQIISGFSREIYRSKNIHASEYVPFYLDICPETFLRIQSILELCLTQLHENLAIDKIQTLSQITTSLCQLLSVNIERIRFSRNSNDCIKLLPILQDTIFKLTRIKNDEILLTCSNVLFSIFKSSASSSEDVCFFIKKLLSDRVLFSMEENAPLQAILLEKICNSPQMSLIFENLNETSDILLIILEKLQLETDKFFSRDSHLLSPMTCFLSRFQLFLLAYSRNAAHSRSQILLLIETLMKRLLQISSEFLESFRCHSFIPDKYAEYFERLQYSFVGTLLPPLCTYFSLINYSLGGEISQLLLDVLSTFSALIKRYRPYHASTSWIRDEEFIHEIIQSSHPYSKGTVDRTITIPGALGLVIRFDSRCATLSNSHSLKVTRSSPRWSCTYSGHGTDSSWPKRYIRLKGDTVSFLWSIPKETAQPAEDGGSKGSSWGFRCAIYAFIPSVREDEYWFDDVAATFAFVSSFFVNHMMVCDVDTPAKVKSLEFVSRHINLVQNMSFENHALLPDSPLVYKTIPGLNRSLHDIILPCESWIHKSLLHLCFEEDQISSLILRLRHYLLSLYQSYKILSSCVDERRHVTNNLFFEDSSIEELLKIHSILSSNVSSDLDRGSLVNNIVQEISLAEKNSRKFWFLHEVTESSARLKPPFAYLQTICSALKSFANGICADSSLNCKKFGESEIYSFYRDLMLYPLSSSDLLSIQREQHQFGLQRVSALKLISFALQSIPESKIREAFLAKLCPLQFNARLELVETNLFSLLKHSFTSVVSQVSKELSLFENNTTTCYRFLRLLNSQSLNPNSFSIQDSDLLPSILKFLSSLQSSVEDELKNLHFSDLCSVNMSRECSLSITVYVFMCLSLCRYECRTCGLTNGNCCCRACAETCHRGHDCYFKRQSRAFCDCGLSIKCKAIGTLSKIFKYRTLVALKEYSSLELLRFVKNSCSPMSNVDVSQFMFRCIASSIEERIVKLESRHNYDDSLLYSLIRIISQIPINYLVKKNISFETEVIGLVEKLLEVIRGLKVSGRIIRAIISLTESFSHEILSDSRIFIAIGNCVMPMILWKESSKDHNHRKIPESEKVEHHLEGKEDEVKFKVMLHRPSGTSISAHVQKFQELFKSELKKRKQILKGGSSWINSLQRSLEIEQSACVLIGNYEECIKFSSTIAAENFTSSVIRCLPDNCAIRNRYLSYVNPCSGFEGHFISSVVEKLIRLFQSVIFRSRAAYDLVRSQLQSLKESLSSSPEKLLAKLLLCDISGRTCPDSFLQIFSLWIFAGGTMNSFSIGSDVQTKFESDSLGRIIACNPSANELVLSSRGQDGLLRACRVNISHINSNFDIHEAQPFFEREQIKILPTLLEITNALFNYSDTLFNDVALESVKSKFFLLKFLQILSLSSLKSILKNPSSLSSIDMSQLSVLVSSLADRNSTFSSSNQIFSLDISYLWSFAVSSFIDSRRSESCVPYKSQLNLWKPDFSTLSSIKQQGLQNNPLLEVISGSIKLPSSFDKDRAMYSLFISENYESVMYVGDSSRHRSGSNPLPMPLISNAVIPYSVPEFYFEVTITSCTSKGISIGLSPRQDIAELSSVHGWCDGSYCIISSTGNIAQYKKESKDPASSELFVGDLVDVLDSVEKWEPASIVDSTASDIKVHYVFWANRYDEWLPRKSDRIAKFRAHSEGYSGQLYPSKYTDPCLPGDTIGCLWNLCSGNISFTKNGTLLHVAYIKVFSRMFPCVTLHDRSASVSINFGKYPFKYNWKIQDTNESEADKKFRLAVFERMENLALQSTREKKSQEEFSRQERHTNALRIIEMGVLPDASIGQLVLALEMNHDNLDRTVSWAVEHPTQFYALQSNYENSLNSDLSRSSDASSLILADEEQKDALNSSSSVADSFLQSANVEHAFHLEDQSSVNEISSQDSRLDQNGVAISNDLENSALGLNLLLSQMQASMPGNQRQQIVQFLESLRSISAAASSLSGANESSSAESENSSDASLIVDLNFGGEGAHQLGNTIQSLNLLSCKGTSLYQGIRVCVSPQAKKSVLDKVSLLDEKLPPWFGVMDSCLGKMGTVVHLDLESNLALVEFYESERSRKIAWWFPFHCLLHVNRIFQLPPAEIISQVPSWTVDKLIIDLILSCQQITSQLLFPTADHLLKTSMLKYLPDNMHEIFMNPKVVIPHQIQNIFFSTLNVKPFYKAIDMFYQVFSLVEKCSKVLSFSQSSKEVEDQVSGIIWEKIIHIPEASSIHLTFDKAFIISEGTTVEFYKSKNNTTRSNLVKVFQGPYSSPTPFFVSGPVVHIICRVDNDNGNAANAKDDRKKFSSMRILVSPIHHLFSCGYWICANYPPISDEKDKQAICSLYDILCRIAETSSVPALVRRGIIKLLTLIAANLNEPFWLSPPKTLLRSLESTMKSESISKQEKLSPEDTSTGQVILHSSLFLSMVEFFSILRLQILQEICADSKSSDESLVQIAGSVKWPAWIEDLVIVSHCLLKFTAHIQLLYSQLFLCKGSINSNITFASQKVSPAYPFNLSDVCLTFSDYCKVVALLDAKSSACGISIESFESDALQELASLCKLRFNIDHAHEHIQFLIWINQKFRKILELVDFDDSVFLPASLSSLFMKSRELIFKEIQSFFFRDILASTSDPNIKHLVKVKIDRTLSFEKPKVSLADPAFIEHGYLPDYYHSIKNTAFGQLMHQLKAVSVSKLRPPKPRGASPHVAFLVRFHGEQVLGQAGPYRGLFSTLSRELEYSAHHLDYPLKLFVPTPNNVHKAGEDRHLFFVNPEWKHVQHLEMYSFLGKLIGVAIRTRIILSVNLPRLFWKLLCKQDPDIRDLAQIDHLLVHNVIIPIENCTSETDFKELVSENDNLSSFKFSVPPSFENRHRVVQELVNFYMFEGKPQIDAIRRGFADIIPEGLLSITSWRYLELLVCGTNDIDIELLRRHTEYSGTDENAPHIQNFWKILKEFSPEERCKFVEFAYGQSRLPSTDEEFVSYPRIRMLIKSKETADPDKILPRADTCFFNLELPMYSTYEIMNDKLRQIVNMDWGMSGDDELELLSPIPARVFSSAIASPALGSAAVSPRTGASQSDAPSGNASALASPRLGQ